MAPVRRIIKRENKTQNKSCGEKSARMVILSVKSQLGLVD
jgi:hypothetical protein